MLCVRQVSPAVQLLLGRTCLQELKVESGRHSSASGKCCGWARILRAVKLGKRFLNVVRHGRVWWCGPK